MASGRSINHIGSPRVDWVSVRGLQQLIRYYEVQYDTYRDVRGYEAQALIYAEVCDKLTRLIAVAGTSSAALNSMVISEPFTCGWCKERISEQMEVHIPRCKAEFFYILENMPALVEGLRHKEEADG